MGGSKHSLQYQRLVYQLIFLLIQATCITDLLDIGILYKCPPSIWGIQESTQAALTPPRLMSNMQYQVSEHFSVSNLKPSFYIVHPIELLPSAPQNPYQR